MTKSIQITARAFVAALEDGGEQAWREVAETPWARKHRDHAAFIEAVRGQLLLKVALAVSGSEQEDVDRASEGDLNERDPTT